MLEPTDVHRWITESLPCQEVRVTGDGAHFEALIVSEAFTGISRIARQQKLNAILGARFESGELHALSMKTFTPQEWQAIQESTRG